MWGFTTVRDGQRAAVWNRRGQIRTVDGPRRVLLLGHDLEWLRRHTATNGEYLVVRYKDGRTEHTCGPVELWFDPVKHERVDVCQCTTVDANEAVVVYRREGERVTRRVLRGPALFMPTADEWLHEFRWHGADPKRPDRKIPRALQFTKLRVIPDQMYFDVEDVRTADDALLKIKLMIFFELTDIEVMLDQTHDPVADFINAVSADVIDFVADQPFERFKERTAALNDLTTYGQLTARAQRIGYKVTKVVYRGYHANDNLQRMHDDAIEARTKLKLEAETEEQAQDLADLKLKRDAERAEERRDMEKADVDHRNVVRQMEHEQKLRQAKLDAEAVIEQSRQENELELERERQANAERLAFLERMKGFEVDLTKYLVAQYQNPDRLIRIDNGGDPARLHLHDQ